MPFTFAHPAAAVPLAQFRLPLSALVVGSMAPDFPSCFTWKRGSTVVGIALLLWWYKRWQETACSTTPSSEI